jgi:hypothetical protein
MVKKSNPAKKPAINRKVIIERCANQKLEKITGRVLRTCRLSPDSPIWGNNSPKAIIFDKIEVFSTGRFLVFYLFL